MMWRASTRLLPLFILIHLIGLPVLGWTQNVNFEELGRQLGVDGQTGKMIDGSIRALQAMRPIGYKEEKSIGEALAIEAFQRFGRPRRNKKLVRYINLVGLSVAMHSNRPDIPYHFAILKNPQPNAFAVPGGYIFVTIGLLKRLQSESELAAVLGHEIAHIAQKHALESIRRNQALKGIGDLSMTALNQNPKVFEQVIDDLSDQIFEQGLGPNVELESDRLGIEYAARAGYQPHSLQQVLKRLSKTEQAKRRHLSKTHPNLNRRARQIQTYVREQYGAKPSGQVLRERFKTVLKK